MSKMIRRVFEHMRLKESYGDEELSSDPTEPAGGEGESPPFAPEANMEIKDDEPDVDQGELPSEPGGIDTGRVEAAAEKAGLLPIEGLDQIDLYDLYDGGKHELEHTKDFDLACAIAAHHIAENPKYYEYLERMEDEMKKGDEDKS